eukprot:scaffold3290_cov165-Ochromonas_danica.AAC.68
MQRGAKEAVQALDPGDNLRLLCIATYCKVLSQIANLSPIAKRIAERSFQEATASDNILEDRALTILQFMRDHIMSLPTPSITLTDDDLAEKYNIFSYPLSFEGLQGETVETRKEEVLVDDVSPNRQQAVSVKMTTARKVRRTLYSTRPVILDTLPSSISMIRALEQIFRAYIRGNALPGQLAGGNAVDLAGQTLSFRSFVLDGPYLSWRGFLSFLLDFVIAKAPPRTTKSGRIFMKSLSTALQDAFAAVSHDSQEPLISMTEAAVIFQEASTSLSPCLVMNKHMHIYTEMAKTGAPDGWASIMAWAEDTSEREWQLAHGINFVQFIDCLGKIGLIGYSSPYFQEMLPTPPEKVEHFLSAYLGLSDKRRWQQKVEKKVQAMKAVIAQLTAPSQPSDKEKKK